MATTPQDRWTKAMTGRVYAAFPLRFGHNQARLYARNVVENAFEWQKNAETGSLPSKAAGLVLSESIPFLPEGYLQYLVAEGVTEKDIKSWWNQPDIYRWLDVSFDLWRLEVYFSIYLEECGNGDEAEWAVYRDQPVFVYWPLGEYEPLTGDDRPLPYELNHRYDVFLRKSILKHGREYLLAEQTNYRTRNALFRATIRSGEA